ncbi:hypothetical protein ACJZ2D_008331 [Fusarium nematophilum]
MTSHDTQQAAESPSLQGEAPQVTVSGDSDRPIPFRIVSWDQKRHSKRTQELHEVLEPLLGTENSDSCVLLLCHGKPSKCQVLPVVIPLSKINANDKSVVWAEIREKWDLNCRKWWHHLPFYGVRRVSIASSISIFARRQSDDSRKSSGNLCQFDGVFTREDIEHQKSLERTIVDRDDHLITDYPCEYDPQTGSFHHSEDCDNMSSWEPGLGLKCPFEKARLANRRLLKLASRPLLTLAFEQPARARANNLLSQDFFYSHRDILGLCNEWRCPSLFEVPFKGLIIDEGWLLSPFSTFILFLGTVFCFTVVSKFMFGDWGAAWGASACIVAIATLVLTKNPPTPPILENSDMVTYKQLQRDLASGDLFSNRITTLQGLRDVLKDSAFLAIDTELVAITCEKDRILHQIGLAYLPTMAQQDPPRTESTSPSTTSRPRLGEFYTENQIQGLTLNINVSKEKPDHLVRLGGHRGMPIRRSHRFGQEQHVDLENSEDVILDFIQSCSNGKANLVMIGFEMAAEWTSLYRVFPRAMPFLSAWVDLRDIAKDITSWVGVIPGLASLLQIFGYNWKDIQPGKGNPKGGIADNAGDDAVATCALAKALLSSENQEQLSFRQECGRIARIFTKKKGYQVPSIWDPFTVTIRAQGPLPSTIDSGMKLARHFFDYTPQHVGIMSADVAFMTFKSQDQMNQFITAANGLALPTGEVLSARFYSQGNGAADTEGGRKEKQNQRESKSVTILDGCLIVLNIGGSSLKDGLSCHGVYDGKGSGILRLGFTIDEEALFTG